MRLPLVVVAIALGLTTPAAARKPAHCYLSVAHARSVIARYEAHEIADRYTISYTTGGHERYGPRKVVLWVTEHVVDPDLGEGDWHHPLHVTIYDGKAHVALEGLGSKPFALPVRCG